MADLDIVGGAAVDVVPIVPNFHSKLKALVLPIADQVGKEAGERMGQAISDNIVIAIPKAVNEGGKAAAKAAVKQGNDTGGAFARSIRTKLTAAFKAMPKLDVKLGTIGVDAELARIRAKLEQLAGKRIGIDVSADAAEAEITRLEAQLRELGAQHPNIAVRADTATARAALAEIKAEIASIPGRREVGLEVDGTFGAKLRAVVEQAQASIPDINVDADTTPARAEIQALRGQLATLADQRVGIDIDAGVALATINMIQERLAVLSISSADIDVRVDAAAAAAELAALQALVDDTKVFNIRAVADTSQASGALLGLAIQFAVLLAIPAFPVAVAGLGAIAAMATAAGAGVGALALAAIPAIKGVTDALKAKKAADDEAAKATDNGAQKSVQAAQKALQMASAQDALAAAHRNAAQSIAQANRGIVDAERAVADAVVRAADQRRQAADAIEQAERTLADAHRGLQRAQEALTDANRDAKRAEEDLTQARSDAADQLSDLNDQLINGAFDQREATLRVQEAQAELNATLYDPKSTALQKAEAQLAFERAVQHAKEQKKDFEELQKSADAQKKAGVEGSDAVISAQERVADAQKNVRDQAQAVADAQRNVREQVEAVADAQTASARAQVDALRTVADAQRGLSDAVQAAADAQVSAAQQVESAERGVESARLSGIDTTAKTISKQDEYRKALAKLSGPQRDLFNAIDGPQGIKGAFDRWQKSLQGITLPVVTRMVDGAKNSLPGLTPLVEGAARGFQTLMDKASAEIKKPFWQDFKKDLSENVEPAVVGLGTAFGNTLKGMAGIVDAFFPHMDGIVKRSDKITGRFANWGTSLKDSPGFQNFLDYVKDIGPVLAEFLGEVLTTVLELAKALAPFSETMMQYLKPMLDALQWLAKNGQGLVLTLWGMYAAQKAIALGMAAFAGAMVLYQTVIAGATLVTAGWAVALNATGIVPVIRAIVLAVALLVAGLIYAYKNWGWFRTAVDGAVQGIKIAALWLWEVVLKPTFAAIWDGLKLVGDAAVWLWDKALRPSFEFIGKAAQFLFTLMVTLFLLPVVAALKLLSWTAMSVWENGLSKVFDWIGKAAMWVWEKGLKPSFNSGKQAFRDFGAVAKWLWEKMISPLFGWIAEKAGWLYRIGIKKPFDDIKHAMSLVADSFTSGKNAIKKAWDQIEGITKKPVKFVVDHVYNAAIVPLWNAVADITGAKDLKKLTLKGFATGGVADGVRPGYTPGRDNQLIAVGGGEAIMRPEWTRAIGEDRINEWNAAARSGGVGGVQRAISSGMPAFASGGVVDDIWGALKTAGNTVADGVKGAADFITNPDKVFNTASDWVKSKMAEFAHSKWGQTVTKIPVTMLKNLKDSIFGGPSDGPTGPATGGVGRALNWVRGKNGLPYQWGGAGNPSYDCSGLMSSIQKVILGQNPFGRLWSTASFAGNTAPAGWVRNLNSPFRIGITNAGVGHTAGTLAGVNVESRGGRGVIVGSGARGWNDSLFTSHYGFKPAMSGASLYDNGGYLPPGLNLVANGTGKPEPVLTTEQWSTLRANSSAGGGTSTIQADVHVYVGDREITDIVRTEITLRDDTTATYLDTGRRF